MALWRLLQQLEEEQVADVFNTVYILRLHRPLMIQTLVRTPVYWAGRLSPKGVEEGRRASGEHEAQGDVRVTPRLPSYPDCLSVKGEKALAPYSSGLSSPTCHTPLPGGLGPTRIKAT